jgi:hypothetical protein
MKSTRSLKSKLVSGIAIAGVLATASLGGAVSPAAAAPIVSGGQLSCYSSAHDPIGAPIANPGTRVIAGAPEIAEQHGPNTYAYIPAFGEYKGNGSWSYTYGSWAYQKEEKIGMSGWKSFTDGKPVTGQSKDVSLGKYYRAWNYVYDYTTQQGEWVRALTNGASGSYYCSP